MTEVSDAERLIAECMPPFGTTSISLSDAVGAILQEPINAERDQPPFDRVTMDGIAIASGDWQQGMRSFQVIGTQGAGVGALTLEEPGQCVEIMTGAVLPANADSVIPVERFKRTSDEAVVQSSFEFSPGQFVHLRGSDRKAGNQLLQPGIRLGAPEIAVAASAGRMEIKVARLPRVAVISTGDELVDAGEPLADYQIRSSNDRAIEAALNQHRLAKVVRSRLKDDRETMLEAVRELHNQNDLLILSGGVSMGRFDFVPSVLEELEIQVMFHRIDQRPGRPMWFGISQDSKPVFALPGNPVSTTVCLYRYVLPALQQALGMQPAIIERLILASDVPFPADLTYFLPIVVGYNDEGTGIAKPQPTNTSGDLVSLAGTDGFVELPRGQDLYPKGMVVRLFRW